MLGIEREGDRQRGSRREVSEGQRHRDKERGETGGQKEKDRDRGPERGKGTHTHSLTQRGRVSERKGQK